MSILSQSYTDFEILILDDCSPDNTSMVAESFSDPRVSYIHNDYNLGHLANYNKGISLARGTYVWLISADDRLRRPYVLERYIRIMNGNPRVGYACCPGVIVRDDRDTTVDGRMAIRDTIFDGKAFLTTLLNGNCIIASSGMVRRTCYERLGGFPLDLPYTGDWYLWCLFALHYGVAYFAEAMVDYRAHELSMTNRLMTHASRSALQEGFKVLWRIQKEAERIAATNIADYCGIRLANLYGMHLVGWTHRGHQYRMSEEELEASLHSEGNGECEQGVIRARLWMAAGDHSVRQYKPDDARQYYRRAAEYDPRLAGLRSRQLFLKTGHVGLQLASSLQYLKRKIM